MENLIKALQILLKYGNPKYPTYCYHEEMRIMEISPNDVSEEDKEELERLSFNVGDDGDGDLYFYTYRLASA